MHLQSLCRTCFAAFSALTRKEILGQTSTNPKFGPCPHTPPQITSRFQFGVRSSHPGNQCCSKPSPPCMNPQATLLYPTTSKAIELMAVAAVVLAPGWDERVADCVTVSMLVFTYGHTTIPPALIFAADSGEHNATPEKVIAAREHVQMVMLHGMAKSLAAQHGNNR